MAVAQESAARGQAKILILDDVLQSVDATIRVAFMDYLLRTFADWQLVLTAHDRLWQAQLRQLLQRYGHHFVDREIVDWSFENGPVARDARTDIDIPLKEALDTARLQGICSEAGLLLESCCDRLSATLPISVTRRKDDRYTLGDLWPGVYKTLRQTAAEPILAEIDKLAASQKPLGGAL